ncbi:MAG: 30S ribosomal protein S12 methylthiotransferase RimO [Deltaproteobacteria bacterium]|nr:30S ribosomal protein S12 methylthiotransferase RimO [Deltaproteobacteria bacterium]
MTKNKKITVSFISLGCPKNLVDSETMIGLLQSENFIINPPDVKSDVSIINTCAFVEDAKKESINTILEIAQKKKKGGCRLLVVTGCLSQRYITDLPQLLPEVDLFVGTGEYHRLPLLIREKLDGQKATSFVKIPRYIQTCKTPRTQTTPFYTRYIKIAEGCSHRCSFCIIPTIRGRLRSRTPADIYKEVLRGVQNGVREFNLIAQDLNEYGRDLKARSSLYKLLDALARIDGDFWIRPLYMYPLQFPDKLVRLIADQPRIAKYVDIPLQHISDTMLKRMNRGSASRYIYRLIDQLKTHVPDITLRTTFLVGHPGETKEDFNELKSFIKQTEFNHVGIFKYSNEEGTDSFLLKDHVPKKTAEARYHELMSIQQKISLKKNKALVGKQLKTLLEGPSRETELLLQGRCEGQAPDIDGVILIRDGTAPVGTFCQVKIVEAYEYDLLGEIQGFVGKFF